MQWAFLSYLTPLCQIKSLWPMRQIWVVFVLSPLVASVRFSWSHLQLLNPHNLRYVLIPSMVTRQIPLDQTLTILWLPSLNIIIHQTRYEKSDWSRAFNQFKIACELDMINAMSAADIAFIMSSSMSAWLLSPLECSPQKQNGWMLHFCFWGWIMWKMYNKTIIEFSFRMISWIIKTSCLCYLPQPSASADNTDLSFDNSWHHAQPHPIIV